MQRSPQRPARRPRAAAASFPAGLVLALFLTGCGAPPAAPPERTVDVAGPDSLGAFVFTDADAWTFSDAAGVPSLELLGGSEYQPPHRSPLGIALLAEPVLGDFTLDVDMQQTGREYGHRDLCLFFGFQSPEQFYYVHLATTPDPNAHNVFLVDRAARRPLAPVAENGVDWGTEEWHHVRLVRELATGAIRVYFDDMDTPVIEAVDATFGAGRIGLGSFDDSGRFANVRVRGEEVDGPPPPDWERK